MPKKFYPALAALLVILMALIASLLATGRYIRMQTSTLYEI